VRVKRNALLLLRTFKFVWHIYIIVYFHLHLIFLFSELISPGSRVEKLRKISHSLSQPIGRERESEREHIHSYFGK